MLGIKWGGILVASSEHEDRETERVGQQRLSAGKAGRMGRVGSVVDPLVEMAEEVVDGEADDVFST